MNDKNVQMRVVLAVLMYKGRYVLQLRDNNPEIPASNMWGLFGGHIEKNENPEIALHRELQEELGIRLEAYQKLGDMVCFHPFWEKNVEYFVFYSDITNLWEYCRLGEGQAMDHFSFYELSNLNSPKIIKNLIKNIELKTPVGT